MLLQVKGQGFVPLNRTIDRVQMKKDKEYVEKNYRINSINEYQIFDTTDYVSKQHKKSIHLKKI